MEKAAAALREAAIERIRFFQDELKQMGLFARAGTELEFFVEDHLGRPIPGAVDLQHVNNALAADKGFAGSPYIEKITYEGATLRGFVNSGLFNEAEAQENAQQYEAVIGHGKGLKPGTPYNAAHYSPLAIARATEAIRRFIGDTMSRQKITHVPLHPDAPETTTTLKANFSARPYNYSEKIRPRSLAYETSGLHINISLYDKHGNNLFHTMPALAHHCGRALVEAQKDGALLCLPTPEAISRLGANEFTPKHFGLATEVHSLGPQPNSITYRIKAPEEKRLENRLPGADADPYVAMALTLGAVWYAAKQHLHYDGKRLRVDSNSQPIPHYDIPKGANDIVHGIFLQRLQESDYLKEILGETLMQAALNVSLQPSPGKSR